MNRMRTGTGKKNRIRGGGILPLIDTEYSFDLLMEQQEQM